MKKRKAAAALVCMALLMGGCQAQEPAESSSQVSEETPATEGSVEESETETSETEAETEATTEDTTPETFPDPPEDAVVPEGYHFVWSDEFDGDELSDVWTREFHPAGWVNNELQAYVASDEYVYVEDGDLVIQPTREVDEDGNVSYYSGRIFSVNKADFKYGYIEARIRTPHGVGFLPAFWMLPARGLYGNWPVSGEIDIMEVVGGDENTCYGTLHYGAPHAQSQGRYTIDSNFSDDYHVFAVEWDPGEITFYVDGEPYHTENDWFCTTTTGSERSYPAPFDKEFSIIFNVAVGGDWPGDPDENTPFDESAQMRVDYVRVYQRDEYNEDVERPERVYNFREPDETGNLAIGEWEFLTASGGVGEADISDDQIVVTATSAGDVDYSLQLINPGLPMIEGETYVFSFEAKADDARTMIANVTGPNVGWTRYFEDTYVDLTSEWQTFTFEFTMGYDDDDAARVEFNLGNQDSVSTVYIRNVRVEQQ